MPTSLSGVKTAHAGRMIVGQPWVSLGELLKGL